MVTAELAAAMPAVALVLVIACGAGGLAVDTVRCADAARAGARALARGEAGVETARRAAPDGAVVTEQTQGDTVVVDVVAPTPRLARWLPGVQAPSGHAVAAAETAEDADGEAP